MHWRIEIKDKEGIFDALGENLKKDILDLGIETVQGVRFVQVYIISGDLSEEEITRISQELLVDNVCQDYVVVSEAKEGRADNHQGGEFAIEIAYNAGVMDPVEESTLKGIGDLGIEKKVSVKTATRYLLKGNLSEEQLKIISEKLLYNKLIQHIVKSPLTSYHLSVPPEYNFQLIRIDLLNASDKRLKELSQKRQLFLNLAEMRRIKEHFQKLGRNPTDCELETIAQTWSEHCWHKTFRGKINYYEQVRHSPSLIGKAAKRQSGKPKLINNLLKSTIMKVTRELKKPWCVSVFQDNSGVIRFDERYNVCFKVETHNHPSALEPFGGANTGIGGVIRDILGTGLGAKPIFNTNVFCFAPPDYPFSRLPSGILHPKRIMKGVVSGVRDYGNKMGIPTLNGAILFHKGFMGNPLVYCGTVGILPKDKSFKEAKVGDLIVLVGGRTGRDGIHGATFSSGELTQQSNTISSTAVQIGNPIQEKKMAEVILEAQAQDLYNAITDCGAGGLSSAVGEMGEALGARVELEKVPLKYSGLSYTEIWISESQERMVLAVPREKIVALMEVFQREDVEATVIGEFTDSHRLQLYYNDNLVCDLGMEFLHKGLPRLAKKAVYLAPKHKEPKIVSPKDLTKYLFKLLSGYDVCSKEWVIRQYDHEVQAGSVLKPLVGVANDGPSDASIVRPILDSNRGLIIANGINFRFGFIDPYWMAASCIDEALRQIIAVGGSLKEVALLDNFCWGNPDKPDRLGSLVRAAYGCYDTAWGFGVPFISGKDSLNNEYTVRGKDLAIPGTLLISAIAVMENVNKAISMYAKRATDLIYLVGTTYPELGGSHYYSLFHSIGNNLPRVSPKPAKAIFNALSKASSLGLIQAMHDCSEGGLAVAAAEMAFAGGLGMDLFLSEVPYKIKNQKSEIRNVEQNPKKDYLRNDFVLFSESNSRFIVEVGRREQKEFERVLKGISFGLVGCLTKERNFKVYGLDGKICINAELSDLKEAWQKPLRW